MKEYAAPDPDFGIDFGALTGNFGAQEFIGIDGGLISIVETFQYQGTVSFLQPAGASHGAVMFDFPVMGISIGLFDNNSIALLWAIYPFLARRIKGGVKVKGRAVRAGKVHYLVSVNPCSKPVPTFFERLRTLYREL